MFQTSRKNLTHAELLTLFLILSPFFDVFNGWLMMNGKAGNVSASYKIVVLAYIFMIIKNRMNKKLLVFILLLAFGAAAQRLLFSMDTAFNVNDYIKLLFPLFLLFVLKELRETERICCIHSVLDFYSWFYPASILIPTVLGIGFHTYGTDNFGFKGFYYAGNELAGVMLIVLAYTIQSYLNGYTHKNLIRMLLMAFTSMIIGMKSLYIGTAVLAVIYIAQLLKRKKTVLWFIPAVVAAVAILAFIVNSDFMKEFIRVQKVRFTYRISGKYENEFLAFMLSGRNDTVIKSFKGLWKYGGINGVLWGIGIDKITAVAGKITEMDFFDLFLWNGLFVAVGYFYLLWTELLKDWRRIGHFEQIGILLMIAFSFLAGHVFYAPSVMIPFVLVCMDYKFDNISEYIGEENGSYRSNLR